MPKLAVADVLSLAVLGLAAGIAPATVSAQGLVTTHRISAAVASELVAGAVAACKEQTYNVTAAVVLDIAGVRQAMLRGAVAVPPQGAAHAAVAGGDRHQDWRRDGRRPRGQRRARR